MAGFSEAIRRKLIALSGNKCYICRKSLINNQGSFVGEAAHIYDDSQTKKVSRALDDNTIEINSLENGFMLCSACHTSIDKFEDGINIGGNTYPADALLKLKAKHEKLVKQATRNEIGMEELLNAADTLMRMYKKYENNPANIQMSDFTERLDLLEKISLNSLDKYGGDIKKAVAQFGRLIDTLIQNQTNIENDYAENLKHSVIGLYEVSLAKFRAYGQNKYLKTFNDVKETIGEEAKNLEEQMAIEAIMLYIFHNCDIFLEVKRDKI